MSKIIVGADIVPTASNQNIFETAQMEQIVDDKLLDILKCADYRIFNLEVPLTDRAAPIKKCGPNLIASTKSVAGLKALGIDFVTLANNHILDQGETGLWDTIEQLDNVGIAYAGVGRNVSEAAEPYVIEVNEKKIGIYCCAEHEFSIVDNTQAGANPFEPLESLDHIVALRDICDYVICLYHGGKEHYRYPTPYLQKTCRKIVEKGADLVVCQHTHCVGCEEKWQTGTIVYGQGNFLFDHSESEFWQTSILIDIDTDLNTIQYIPLCKNKNGVILSQDEEILNLFRLRSEEIKNEEFIKTNYELFCDEFSSLLLLLAGINVNGYLYRGINKLSGYKFGRLWAKKNLSVDRKLRLRNYIECEAWREILLTKLKV